MNKAWKYKKIDVYILYLHSKSRSPKSEKKKKKEKFRLNCSGLWAYSCTCWKKQKSHNESPNSLWDLHNSQLYNMIFHWIHLLWFFNEKCCALSYVWSVQRNKNWSRTQDISVLFPACFIDQVVILVIPIEKKFRGLGNPSWLHFSWI